MEKRADIILGKLPDPFLLNNGKRVETVEDWRVRRQEIIDTAVQLEFDGMPPKPDRLEVEQLTYSGWGKHKANCYRVHCIVGEKDFTYCFTTYQPEKEGKYPFLITGDAMYYRKLDDQVIEEANRRGFIVVKFNRTEFAPDIYEDVRETGIYKLFEGRRFSAISAWAWGYHRTIDALIKLNYDYFDTSIIAIAGHSRGGKTALLAAATDERITFVNPSCSGTHGCGCYRFHQVETEGEYNDMESEKLKNLFYGGVPYWMGDGLKEYIGREQDLPHDMHFIKALVAPRYLFETNGYADIWANPRGSYISHLAVKEVYKFLGKEENCQTYYREGGHGHLYGDFMAYLDFIECMLQGKEYKAKVPYDDVPELFDWRAPESK